MEWLVWGARVLAIYGAVLMAFGVFYMPEILNDFLSTRNARFGIAISGVIAIIVGFFLATIGG